MRGVVRQYIYFTQVSARFPNKLQQQQQLDKGETKTNETRNKRVDDDAQCTIARYEYVKWTYSYRYAKRS